MREGQFIKQNIGRWKSYEQSTDDPDEIARRFTYLVDDLAYAKTFYPKSNTGNYINGMAAEIYLSIYKNKKEQKSRITSFFITELPLILYRHRLTLLFTLLFFSVFVAIGVFSAKYDQMFVRSIMGDGYVDMTERNIAKGDPFGVYKQDNAFSMFLRIAFNNISVAFYCFAMGITASIGTLYLLFKNGIMLGAFEYMFFKHGLGVQSILVIFIHGTLEISAIVVAGGAGLIIGNSLLFPKTYTRIQSLTMGAKDAIKIMVSLVPIFFVAAFFEGYVTRYTNMPVWASILILGSSLWFMIWYFVIYPAKVHRRNTP